MSPPETPPRSAITLKSSALDEMSKNERIKAESKGLYFVSDGKGDVHPFRDEIEALERGEKPTIGSEAKELSKFHGIYKQQGRGERGKKIAGDYFFMVRIKCPAGGKLDGAQWLALDEAAEKFTDGTIRLTSRQSIQYHHVLRPEPGPVDPSSFPALPPGWNAERLRRRQPQRHDVAHRYARPGARCTRHGAGLRAGRGSGAEVVLVLPGLDLRCRRQQARRAQSRGAALRKPVPAAKVQGRDRASARQLRGRPDAGRGLRARPDERKRGRKPLGSLHRGRSRHDPQQPGHRAAPGPVHGPDPAGAGGGGGARHRDPAEGARGAEGPAPGALEVHAAASRRGCGQGRAARPLRPRRSSRRRAAAAGAHEPPPGLASRPQRPRILRHLGRERPHQAGAARRPARGRDRAGPLRASHGAAGPDALRRRRSRRPRGDPRSASTFRAPRPSPSSGATPWPARRSPPAASP